MPNPLSLPTPPPFPPPPFPPPPFPISFTASLSPPPFPSPTSPSSTSHSPTSLPPPRSPPPPPSTDLRSFCRHPKIFPYQFLLNESKIPSPKANRKHQTFKHNSANPTPDRPHLNRFTTNEHLSEALNIKCPRPHKPQCLFKIFYFFLCTFRSVILASAQIKKLEREGNKNLGRSPPSPHTGTNKKFHIFPQPAKATKSMK